MLLILFWYCGTVLPCMVPGRTHAQTQNGRLLCRLTCQGWLYCEASWPLDVQGSLACTDTCSSMLQELLQELTVCTLLTRLQDKKCRRQIAAYSSPVGLPCSVPRSWTFPRPGLYSVEYGPAVCSAIYGIRAAGVYQPGRRDTWAAVFHARALVEFNKRGLAMRRVS